MYYFIQEQAIYAGFIFTLIIAYTAALIGAFLICTRYAIKNKTNNSGIYDDSKNTSYYIKRMGFIVIMTVLMSLGVSFVCTFLSVIGGIGVIMKISMFILYLVLIYKMFIRYGFMDCEKKIFNLNFKMLTFMVSLIIMLPNALYDSIFYTQFDTILNIQNVQSALSPSILYLFSDIYLNQSQNIFLCAISVLLTFAIQAGVVLFAYKRGKQIFIKQHIRKTGEYEMDENI
jgi:hypothetical protein